MRSFSVRDHRKINRDSYTVRTLAQKMPDDPGKPRAQCSESSSPRRVLPSGNIPHLINPFDGMSPTSSGTYPQRMSEDEVQAAAKIQAMHRGKMTRKEMMEQQAAASKIAAVQRGKQDRARVQGMKIEKELGLTGSEEEQARIAKMQAAQRGKMARKEVAAMKEAKAERGAEAEAEAQLAAAEEE